VRDYDGVASLFTHDGALRIQQPVTAYAMGNRAADLVSEVTKGVIT
jgi:hypothetical protein